VPFIRSVLRWGFERSWHWPPVLAWQLLPRFRAAHGRWPRLFRPRSFADKCLYRMLFDRRPIIGVFGGKTEVRAFIAERLGDTDALIPRIGLIRTVGDLRRMALPRAFLMKSNHGSGQVHVARDWDGTGLDALEDLVEGWLRLDYGKYGGEWCYKDVERIVVVEALLEQDGVLPQDYKFWCFDGRVEIFNFIPRMLGQSSRDVFDRNGAWLPIDFLGPRSAAAPALSAAVPRMVAMAERLSAGLDFVRVDLIECAGRIYVTEMTPYPNAAGRNFLQADWDRSIGERWAMPSWRALRGG